MAKSTSSEWQVVTYTGDNDGAENIIVQGGGRKINLGKITKGQKVNVPVGVVDGVNFVTDAQLVEGFTAKKPTRRKRKVEEK